tara:strand:+ start:268 stop:498 length:231 start_codon:yes stop_codon:yes gene_type:complete
VPKLDELSKPNALGLICTECKEVLPSDDSIFLIDKDDVKRNVFDFLDNIKHHINNSWLWCDECQYLEDEDRRESNG